MVGGDAGVWHGYPESSASDARPVAQATESSYYYEEDAEASMVCYSESSSTPYVSESTPYVHEPTPYVHVPTPVVSESTVIISEPTPVVSESTPEEPTIIEFTPTDHVCGARTESSSTPYVHTPTPYVHEPTPYVHEPTPYVHVPTPYVHVPTPYVHTPTPYVHTPTPVVSESTVIISEPTPVVSESTPEEPTIIEFTPTDHVCGARTESSSTPYVHVPTPYVHVPTPYVHEPTPSVSEYTPSEPTIIEFTPTDHVCRPTPVVSESTVIISEPTPVVSESTVIISEPTPVVSESTVIISEPTPVLSEPTPVISEPTPYVHEPTPVLSEPTPYIPYCTTESTVIISEPTPVVSEPTPVISEPTPVISEPTPVIYEPTPVVYEPTPVVYEPTPVVSDTSASSAVSDTSASSAVSELISVSVELSESVTSNVGLGAYIQSSAAFDDLRDPLVVSIDAKPRVIQSDSFFAKFFTQDEDVSSSVPSLIHLIKQDLATSIDQSEYDSFNLRWAVRAGEFSQQSYDYVIVDYNQAGGEVARLLNEFLDVTLSDADFNALLNDLVYCETNPTLEKFLKIFNIKGWEEDRLGVLRGGLGLLGAKCRGNSIELFAYASRAEAEVRNQHIDVSATEVRDGDRKTLSQWLVLLFAAGFN